MNQDLARYYALRAEEYERIYQIPERQEDLKTLAQVLSIDFRDREVLEVACGTGYWTRFIAQNARSVLATDANLEMLALARPKDYLRPNVSFRQVDAFSLDNISGQFTGGFAGFWWSHVSYEKLPVFLDRFHARLQRDALVVFVDNIYLPGYSSPLSRTDEQANTYQLRTLGNGSTHEIIKNYPTGDLVKRYLGDYAYHLEFIRLSYYWLVKYNLNKNGIP